MKLTKEQEALAFQLIRKGDADSEHHLKMFVYCNQPLVSWVARDYRNKGLTWEALISAGNMGLLQAVKVFDPSRGNKFSTCAEPWIKGAITEAFKATNKQKRGDRAIMQTENGVPLVFEDDPNEVIADEPTTKNTEKAESLHPELQDDLTLADHMDLQEAVAQEAECDIDREAGEKGYSAHEARSEGVGSSAGCAEWDNLRGEDPSSDPKPAGGLSINFAADQSTGAMSVDADMIPALEQAIKKLEARQAQVFAMHRGLCGYKQHTLAEIGAQFGFSAQRAQAIFKSTFTQLRNDPTLEMLFELTN